MVYLCYTHFVLQCTLPYFADDVGNGAQTQNRWGVNFWRRTTRRFCPSVYLACLHWRGLSSIKLPSWLPLPFGDSFRRVLDTYSILCLACAAKVNFAPASAVDSDSDLDSDPDSDSVADSYWEVDSNCRSEASLLADYLTYVQGVCFVRRRVKLFWLLLPVPLRFLGAGRRLILAKLRS